VRKHKTTPSCTGPVKNRRKAINIEDKLDIKSRLGKGDKIVDICRVVRFAHSSSRIIPDNADRIKQTANSGTEVFVSEGCQSDRKGTVPKTKDVILL
jgi:hypothetical protein